MKKKYLLFFIISLVANLKVITYLEQHFNTEYLTTPMPNEDVIFSYKSYVEFSKANEFYFKDAEIEIDQVSIDRIIKYEDVPKIATLKGVEQIIMLDYQFFDQLKEKFLTSRGVGDFLVISVPNYINKENDLLGFLFGINEIKEGRLPIDFKNEIALSEDQLINYFGYNLEMINDPIGQTIIYDGESYTIVGLTYTNIAYLSYEPIINLGFKQYNPEDFDIFSNLNIQYKERKNILFTNEVDELLIYTTKGAEKGVLNQLIKTFPAENYFSSSFLTVWIKSYLWENTLSICFMNILLISVTNFGLNYLNRRYFNVRFSYYSLFSFYGIILILTFTAPSHFYFKIVSIINTFILIIPHFLNKTPKSS